MGEVVESRADGFAPGDIVCARRTAGGTTRVVGAGEPRGCGGVGTLRAARTARRRPPEAYPRRRSADAGLTAYAGLLHVAELRDGDVVWVSAAAGAVGSAGRADREAARATA